MRNSGFTSQMHVMSQVFSIHLCESSPSSVSFEAVVLCTEVKFQFPVEHCRCFFLFFLIYISSELQQASSPEQEDGIIPDSPVLPSSLPVLKKLKKHRNLDRMKCVRYAEVPLLQSNNSLFKGQSAPL